MLKVGLTGSTGMIGRHMKRLLKQEEIECLCINRDMWDLCDWKTINELDHLFNGVEVVFHFGAALPQPNSNSNNSEIQTIFDANVKSCLNLAEWAVKRNVSLVFLSGSTVYENPHTEKISENAPKVINGLGGFYGYSKLLAEKVFEHFVASGLQLIILRPSSVYGVGLAEDKLIRHYLNNALRDQPILLTNPNNRINFIHALDVSKAALQAVLSKAWGAYNIASNQAPTIKELAEAIVNICAGGRVTCDYSSTEKPFLRFDLDTTKATRSFSFCQSLTLEDGLILMRDKKEV